MTASATVLSVGLGPLFAGLYGPSYGPIATLLPILVAGTIPFAATMTLLTTARVREHSYSTIAVAVVFAAGVLVPTALLTARHGAVGAAWGWTMGNAIAAVLALLASRLLERRRTGAGAAQRRLPPHPSRRSPTERRAEAKAVDGRSRSALENPQSESRQLLDGTQLEPRAVEDRLDLGRVAAPASGSGEVPSRSYSNRSGTRTARSVLVRRPPRLQADRPDRARYGSWKQSSPSGARSPGQAP